MIPAAPAVAEAVVVAATVLAECVAGSIISGGVAKAIATNGVATRVYPGMDLDVTAVHRAYEAAEAEQQQAEANFNAVMEESLSKKEEVGTATRPMFSETQPETCHDYEKKTFAADQNGNVFPLKDPDGKQSQNRPSHEKGSHEQRTSFHDKRAKGHREYRKRQEEKQRRREQHEEDKESDGVPDPPKRKE